MADSIYNEDELVSPDWMNMEFFAMVISKYENNSLVLVNFSANILFHYLKILLDFRLQNFTSF